MRWEIHIYNVLQSLATDKTNRWPNGGLPVPLYPACLVLCWSSVGCPRPLSHREPGRGPGWCAHFRPGTKRSQEESGRLLKAPWVSYCPCPSSCSGPECRFHPPRWAHPASGRGQSHANVSLGQKSWLSDGKNIHHVKGPFKEGTITEPCHDMPALILMWVMSYSENDFVNLKYIFKCLCIHYRLIKNIVITLS